VTARASGARAPPPPPPPPPPPCFPPPSSLLQRCLCLTSFSNMQDISCPRGLAQIASRRHGAPKRVRTCQDPLGVCPLGVHRHPVVDHSGPPPLVLLYPPPLPPPCASSSSSSCPLLGARRGARRCFPRSLFSRGHASSRDLLWRPFEGAWHKIFLLRPSCRWPCPLQLAQPL